MIVMLRQFRGGRAVPRKQREEPVEPFGVEAKTRRELPQERPQLLLQPQHAGGEEIGKRRFDIAQLLQMGDEAAALDRKDEILRCFVMPAGKGFGALQRLMRAVDLDRVEKPAGIGELVALAQFLRIEAAAPAGIAPAGDAGADSARPGCGTAAHRLLSPRHGTSSAC